MSCLFFVFVFFSQSVSLPLLPPGVSGSDGVSLLSPASFLSGSVLPAFVGVLPVALLFCPVHTLRHSCLGLWSSLRILVHGSSLLGPLLVLFLRTLCVSFPQCGFSGFFLYSFSSSHLPLPFARTVFMRLLLQLFWPAMGPCPPVWRPLLGVRRLFLPRSLCVISSFPPGVGTVGSGGC